MADIPRLQPIMPELTGAERGSIGYEITISAGLY